MSNSAAREVVTCGGSIKASGDGNLPTLVFSTAAAMEAKD
jgi:hypothetical protein